MDEKVINGIRNLSLDMINESNSGHPGICLGAAPILYTLFQGHLTFNPDDGAWLGRDRFIMSPGHGSALLYSTLFFAGYPLKLEDLKSFRQMDSLCSGHPELNIKIGVEATTGVLGQGFGSAVGMAIAEKYLSFNLSKEIFDNYTYVLVSDGDLMEGVSYEAASLAGSLKLNKLIVLYDSNNVTLDGDTKSVFDEDVIKRFDSLNWHTEEVTNAEDIASINKAINNAKSETNKPSFIKINTTIGKYSKYEGTSVVHGKPLDADDLTSIKSKLKVNPIPFYISKEAVEHFRNSFKERNEKKYNDWNKKYEELISEEGLLTKTLKYMSNNDYHINLKNIKINMDDKYNEELRIANGRIINLISSMCPALISASADLFSSTKTYINEGHDFTSSECGRNIHFGVRESLMASAMNGLSLYGTRVIGSTFLTFADHMKPSIRLSCLMNLPVTYVFTHDNFEIGEDGATHQPIEQLSMLRSIPNMTVLRPADIKEIVGSWDYIINNKKPISLVVSKDKYPPLDNTSIKDIYNGAYIIKKERTRLSGIILASGCDVHKAHHVSSLLEKKAIYTRVVSVPSLEIFQSMSEEYKKEILPDGYKKIVIESSNDTSWRKYTTDEYIININKFGKSAKKKDLHEYFEFDAKTLTEKIEKLLN